MPRTWTGRRAARALAYVLTRDRGLCWLCHHHGANSVDHVRPVSLRPDLEWDPSNWKACHLEQAGSTRGCPVPGCRCIGNKKRGNRPTSRPPSRRW